MSTTPFKASRSTKSMDATTLALTPVSTFGCKSLQPSSTPIALWPVATKSSPFSTWLLTPSGPTLGPFISIGSPWSFSRGLVSNGSRISSDDSSTNNLYTSIKLKIKIYFHKKQMQQPRFQFFFFILSAIPRAFSIIFLPQSKAGKKSSKVWLNGDDAFHWAALFGCACACLCGPLDGRRPHAGHPAFRDCCPMPRWHSSRVLLASGQHSRVSEQLGHLLSRWWHVLKKKKKSSFIIIIINVFCLFQDGVILQKNVCNAQGRALGLPSSGRRVPASKARCPTAPPPTPT